MDCDSSLLLCCTLHVRVCIEPGWIATYKRICQFQIRKWVCIEPGWIATSSAISVSIFACEAFALNQGGLRRFDEVYDLLVQLEVCIEPGWIATCSSLKYSVSWPQVCIEPGWIATPCNIASPAILTAGFALNQGGLCLLLYFLWCVV